MLTLQLYFTQRLVVRHSATIAMRYLDRSENIRRTSIALFYVMRQGNCRHGYIINGQGYGIPYYLRYFNTWDFVFIEGSCSSAVPKWCYYLSGWCTLLFITSSILVSGGVNHVITRFNSASFCCIYYPLQYTDVHPGLHYFAFCCTPPCCRDYNFRGHNQRPHRRPLLDTLLLQFLWVCVVNISDLCARHISMSPYFLPLQSDL